MRSLFSAEAEQSVIGSILLDSDVFSDVDAIGLSSTSFFDSRNALVYCSVKALVEANKPVDAVIVAEHLEADGVLKNIGGISFLGEAIDAVPTAKNAAGYAQIVYELEEQREWYKTAQAITDTLLDDQGGDHDERIGKIQLLLTKVERENKTESVVRNRPALKGWFEHMEENYKNPEIRGLRTGFEHLDYRYGGMEPGEFGVIAGRPGMGKTAMALNIVRDVSVKQKKTVLVFSLEMPTRQLVQRMVAAEGKIKIGLLKSGKALEITEQAEKLNMAFGKLARLGGDDEGEIWWDDSAGLTISDLVARAKRINRDTPIDLIMVDHIGLVDSTLKTENEPQRLAQITKQLKKLARELKCIVVGLSQLNREVEKRANKRPMISDLKGSSSIEQDADWIMLLYRDEYYDEDSLTPNQVEVISGKVREAEKGTDYLAWRGEYNLLESPPEGGFIPKNDEAAGESYL